MDNDIVQRLETATMLAAAAKRGLTQIPTMDAQALLLMLKEQDGIIDSLKSDLSETLDVVTNRKNVVRCKDCWKKGNPYLCRFDRDLEEHGSHRTEADDDWFCADGVKNDE